MNRRCVIPAVLIVFHIISGVSYGLPVKRPLVTFDKWGFGIRIPQPFVKHDQSSPGTLLQEIYSAKDLGYIVTVVQPPQDSLTSTSIEQTLQVAYKAALDKGATRWEMPLDDGTLFKGITRRVELSDPLRTQMPYIQELLGEHDGLITISMTPLGDESSPMLSVGVIGPITRDNEIETEGKFLASTFTSIKQTLVEVKPILPKQAKPLQKAHVKPTIKKPAIKKPSAIKKGHIELTGVVQSMNFSTRCIIILVDQVREPGWGTVKLTKSREKQVFVKKIPQTIGIGKRVVVDGKNLGVGKPIHADRLEVVDK